jgi:myo-inositol 2-dehydrogenase / D-chiro-inositol 1-dehydrogenase
MNENISSRRNFLSDSSKTGTGLLIMSAKTALGSQANSALSVGLIGVGNRGSAMTERHFKPMDQVRVAAICDIYDDKLEAGSQKFPKAKLFKDYRELLAADNIDAVYIATPPFLHPEHFEAAVNAKKHIFMEKPAGVDVKGCKRVLAAAKKADTTRRISVDFQQRYGVDYNKAKAILDSGRLGKVLMVRGAWLGGGLPEFRNVSKEETGIRNWLYSRDRGGDIIVEQQCHNLDVVNWFMGQAPLKAMGYGNRGIRMTGDILDSTVVSFQFADKRLFSYSGAQVEKSIYRDIGEYFICERGTLHTSRQGYEVYTGGVGAKTNEIAEEAKTTYDITRDAVQAFVKGSLSGQIENAAIWAVESTMTAIMAREAMYRGREVTLASIS